MIVQIDHAGKDKRRRIQLDEDRAINRRSDWRALTLPNSNNAIASHQNATAFDYRMLIVHGHDGAAKDQPTRGIEHGR
jgi:hypothetical protein